jgi:predicted nucleic acid-binding protein
LTLYVESNFVVEIALGQEELAAAERLMAAAESGAVDLALPALSLSEPFATLTQHARNRARLRTQLDDHLRHLARSLPHRLDVADLHMIPDVLARIDRREDDRLNHIIERLLTTAIVIETDLATFRRSRQERIRFGLTAQDAIVYAAVLRHLQDAPFGGPHIFASKNKRDFTDARMVRELADLGCTLVYSFSDAVARLGLPRATDEPHP